MFTFVPVCFVIGFIRLSDFYILSKSLLYHHPDRPGHSRSRPASATRVRLTGVRPYHCHRRLSADPMLGRDRFDRSPAEDRISPDPGLAVRTVAHRSPRPQMPVSVCRQGPMTSERRSHRPRLRRSSRTSPQSERRRLREPVTSIGCNVRPAPPDRRSLRRCSTTARVQSVCRFAIRN